MRELQIDSIRVNLRSYQRVVILKEKDQDRYLPIWIGMTEADAIAFRLQDVTVARPQTHDLLASVIGELGGTVVQVVVNDMSNDIYYARIHMDVGGKRIEIDSRPSDAIALAVRASAPIYAEDSVLDSAGVVLNAEGEVEQGDENEAATPVTEEELERLAAFRDFISSLDLDDLDRPAASS
ncbi:MAG: bifunctional nuclease family protein [Dehalococcoidia bacterium]